MFCKINRSLLNLGFESPPPHQEEPGEEELPLEEQHQKIIEKALGPDKQFTHPSGSRLIQRGPVTLGERHWPRLAA